MSILEDKAKAYDQGFKDGIKSRIPLASCANEIEDEEVEKVIKELSEKHGKEKTLYDDWGSDCYLTSTNLEVKAAIDLIRCLYTRVRTLEDVLSKSVNDFDDMLDKKDERIAELKLAERDAAFYKSCALSGEVPKPGSEPSSQC